MEDMMTAEVTPRRLDVPGGSLHHEVRGTGPLLLVIGQPMTSVPFASVADLLAEHYTVVTYDPRGLGESKVDDPSLPVTPEVEADDLAQIVDEVGGGPAEVFGSSGGAVAGLALAARHPDKVRTLIAHEPPVCDLLPDAPHVRAVIYDIEEAYRSYGPGAAWGKFVSLVMHDGLVTEAGVPPVTWPPPGQNAPNAADTGSDPPAPSEKQQADDELFFLRMLKPFTRYQPTVDTLRSGAPRVLIAVGETSRGEVAKRSAVALAERLGTAPVTFPGDHGGFMADPVAFADRIRQVLRDTD
jgi:pimeloyl-ACP methyl ester carboxylesterase